MTIKFPKKNKYNFLGKTVMVTGASRGIGLKISKDFKSLGAKVIALSTKDFDLSTEEGIEKLIIFLSKIKKIDILVNNAGINFSEDNANFSTEKYEKLMNVNLKAPFVITKVVSRKMIKNKFGRIINISSIASERVRAGRSAYSASKFGLVGFTKTLSIELAKYNILVNSVSPGFIATDMTRTMLSKKEIKKLSKQVPMQRLGNPGDISNAVIFLSSQMNQFITGHNLIVDGGFIGSISV